MEENNVRWTSDLVTKVSLVNEESREIVSKSEDEIR